MSDRDDLPIEPLSDLAWERIEANLFAELDSPTTLVHPLASRASALADPPSAVSSRLDPKASSRVDSALARVSPLSARRARPAAEGTDVTSAKAGLRRVERRAAALGVGLCALAAAGILLFNRHPGSIPQGTEFATTAEPRALTLDGTEIALGADSLLAVVRERDEALEVSLVHGEARIAVAEYRSFLLRSGDVSVGARRGTFSVTAREDSLRVAVETGSVLVRFAGSETRLVAGGLWTRPRIVELGLARDHAIEAGTVDPLIETATPMIETTMMMEAAPTMEAPLSEQQVESEPMERLNHPIAPALRGDLEIHRARRPRADGRLAGDDLAASDTHRSEPDYQQVFEDASRRESREPARALELYLSIQEGPWAPAALFAAGRLELDRGRRDPALALLRRYLARYPNGSNARDARDLINAHR